MRHILKRQHIYGRKFLWISTDSQPIGQHSRYVIPSDRQPCWTNPLCIQPHTLHGHSERRGAVRLVSTPASYYSSSRLKSRPGDRVSLFTSEKSPAVPLGKCWYRLRLLRYASFSSYYSVSTNLLLNSVYSELQLRRQINHKRHEHNELVMLLCLTINSKLHEIRIHKQHSRLLGTLASLSWKFQTSHGQTAEHPKFIKFQLFFNQFSVMGLLITPIIRTHFCNGLFWCSQNSARRFINATFNWLVWSKYTFASETEDLSMSIDTEMTWAYPDSSSDRVILYDLYKINYSWPINGTLAGHWTLKEGIVFNLTQYKYSRRQDLRGIVYTAALVVSRLSLSQRFVCTCCLRAYEHKFPLNRGSWCSV